ncbi:MAG: adhesin [Methanosphaera sp. rholeuAM270]|nr:MAG: adhesin [Methanosphaera sp. rholeuAM270]
MKKEKILILITILLLCLSFIQTTMATTVFLTSDHIGSNENDLSILQSVKKHIEEITNGEMEVIIDPYAPSPGEGTRAIESDADVSVNFAASDAGNFLVLAKAAQNINKQLMLVNMGNLDLENKNYIRRAWDDNYSSDYFAGINSPGKFLEEVGISYIQPLKEYPNLGESYTSSDEEANRYIAQQIVDKIQEQKSNKYYDNDLIVTHSMHPSQMAQASKEIMQTEDTKYDGKYHTYTAPQVLYLTSSYLNGNGLVEPGEYQQPDSPLETSILTKNTYTVYDYMKMGSIVKTYMDENRKAPDYINYDGAIISYSDLVHNFAKITENHTDSKHMDFASEYRFEKVNSSLLIDILPFALFALVILAIYGIFKRITKRKSRRR